MATIKKKLIGFIVCLCLVFSLGFVVFGASNTTMCYAASSEQTMTVTTTEETEENTPTIETTEEPNPTFFGRIWEWVENNYSEIIATLTGFVTLLLTTILPNLLKKRVKNIDDKILKNNTTQAEVVEVVNALIESYNKIEEKLNNYTSTEEERYTAVGSMVAQTKAILEILTTVYANSKNIPQGVKDLVNLKYANVLKLVEDEEKLKEVVVEANNEESIAEETQISDTEV